MVSREMYQWAFGYLTRFAATSETGNPFSPSLMAGAKISPIVTFALPNLSWVSTQPAAAPGTVTAWALLKGMCPSSPSPTSLRILSRVHLAPERPEPFIARTSFFSASQKRMNMSPPIPVEQGSVMFRPAAGPLSQHVYMPSPGSTAYRQLPQHPGVESAMSSWLMTFNLQRHFRRP